jgi:hypothetical protein
MLKRLFSVLLLCILFVVGCNRSYEQTADVSGKVTYLGKPLPGGKITFVGARGYMGFGIISPQGEYSLQSPLGEVEIAVDNTMLKRDPTFEKFMSKGMAGGKNPMLKDAPEGKAEEPQSKEEAGKQVTGRQGVVGTYISIPGRYANPTLSGLKMTVTQGSHTHNIELTDAAPAPTPDS